MAGRRDVSAPVVTDDTVMLIIEKLVELRKEYHTKISDPDMNGQYHYSDTDKTILEDVNVVLKWVASGGFG